jgi:hypothetical protein
MQLIRPRARNDRLLRMRAVCTILVSAAVVIAVLAPATAVAAATFPGATLRAGSTVVPAAGHVVAKLLPRQPSGISPGGPWLPFRPMNSEALRTAKLRADAASYASSAPSSPAGPSTGSVFNGLNQPGLAAADEGSVATPPDSTGAIGPTRYIEMVNQMIGVYDRSNLTQLSHLDFGTFGRVPSGIPTTDPQVQWDPQANRWLYAFIGFSTGNNYLLFGWTKTADPSDLSNGWCTYGVATGSNIQDYPKLGHDSHFLTVGTNVYTDTDPKLPFVTANIWAVAKPPTTDTTCSTPVSATYFADATHLLKNADGTLAFTPIPANTADAATNDYIVAAHDPTLSPQSKAMIWHMTAAPGATLVADGDVSVGSNFAIPPGVPQPGVSYLLDSLDGRFTQAVAHFDPAAGAEAVWTQHTVAGSGRSVIRWYEFLPATLKIYQQGQLQSATDYFFNAAISPTSSGSDASISYSRGSSTQLALIGAQTRTSSTPLGKMDAGEIVLGTSSAADQETAFQGNCTTNPCRWGDYSGASPDPNNANVVWGSNQLAGPVFLGYAQWTTQNFAISTRPPGPDFSLSASPSSQTVIKGSGTSYTITITRTLGFSSAVTLSVGGLPAGASGTFSPNPASGTSSNLTVGTSSTTPTGSSLLTISGTGGSLTRTTTATLVVNPVPTPDFSLSASPASQTVAAGSGTSYTVTITPVAGFSGAVTFSVSGLPSGAAGTFSPNPSSGPSSTLTVTTSGSTPAGSYPLTITGTSGSLTHSAGATLVVSAAPPCATASLSPASTTQSTGSTINFTATSTGCPNPQYEFWLQDLSGSWTIQQAFSASPSWSWNTAGFAAGTYTVHVWANQLGDPTARNEAFGSSTVTLTGCTAAGLTAAPTSPQPTGTLVKLTATSSGCSNPQYEFWLQDTGGGWSMKQGFGSSAIWNWDTTGFPVGNYTIHVWANQMGDPTGTWEAFGTLSYTLSVGTSTGVCQTAALTVSPSAQPQPPGTQVKFTATSTGCSNPLYEFWLQDTSGSWSMKQAFGSAIWNWDTTGFPGGNYTVHVWADQSGSDLSTWQAYGTISYSLTMPPACTGASISPSNPSFAAGSTVNLTASSTGCPNPQYEFWVQYLDTNWYVKQNWGGPAFTWSTAGLAPGSYSVHVWANQIGNSTATWEANGSTTVTLTGCTSAAIIPANGSAPAGGVVTFTASASGCATPVYEFWLQDTGGAWQMVRVWGTGNAWQWNTAGLAKGTYTLHVWANQQGADMSTYETFGTTTFTLT